MLKNSALSAAPLPLVVLVVPIYQADCVRGPCKEVQVSLEVFKEVGLCLETLKVQICSG